LIIITVFPPLLTLQDLEGKFFVPVALTIVFALAASLLLADCDSRLVFLSAARGQA
jgi:cobalt-zinc-cadmium resistance protein CzcA